jgi:hypothetical protein
MEEIGVRLGKNNHIFNRHQLTSYAASLSGFLIFQEFLEIRLRSIIICLISPCQIFSNLSCALAAIF